MPNSELGWVLEPDSDYQVPLPRLSRMETIVLCALEEERAALAVYKYAIVGSALMVPIVMGLVAHASLEMGDRGFGEFSAIDAATQRQITETGLESARIYLLLISLVISAMLALQSGTATFLIYALPLAPFAQLAFSFVMEHGLGF